MPSFQSSFPFASCSPPVHIHSESTECLTLRNGELGYLINGTEHVARAGDGSVRIEPGMPHTYWNAVRMWIWCVVCVCEVVYQV